MVAITKSVVGIADAGVTNDETAIGWIDTIGFDYGIFNVVTSPHTATTDLLTTITLSEGPDTDISNATAITECVGGTAFDLPTAVFTAQTAGVTNVQFNMDLDKRSRFIFAQVTPVTTVGITYYASLTRGDEAPVTATKANVDVLVEV